MYKRILYRVILLLLLYSIRYRSIENKKKKKKHFSVSDVDGS